MKVLGWILIIVWIGGGLYLLSDVVSGVSTDIFSDLLGVALVSLQVYFNFKIVQKLK